MSDTRKANSIRHWFVQLGLPIAVAASLVVGVVVFGQQLRDRLNARGIMISFADLECEHPKEMTRQQFLEEAQYLAALPDQLDALDKSTPSRIHTALSAHPWVARVKEVRVGRGGRCQVQLQYRTPVLAVTKPAREVDSEGILLPRSTRRKGLPVLTTAVIPPAGRPGESWGDVRVTAAAQVVSQLLPHVERMGLASFTVDVENGEVVLGTTNARILWGRPPGQEKEGEALAETKLQRLPDSTRLTGQEWDLRPASAATSRSRGR
jgi:hypothetical protein